METPVVSVIINSHNTKAFTCLAIQAVMNSTYIPYEIIVVENASTDGSLQEIRTQFPKVTLIKQKTLIGFGAANMIGASRAKGAYLFFLNPDTEVYEGAIDALVSYLKEHPQCGACSGTLLNTDGSIQPQGGALPNLFNVKMWMLFLDDLPFVSLLMKPYQQRSLSYFYKEQNDCGWVGGTAFMISAKVFEKVGGWDTHIYMYGEDVELCARLHKFGYAIGYTPKAKIVHHQHKSAGTARSRVGEFEGLIYIWKKHHKAWELPVLRLILWFGAWLRIIIFGILGGNAERKITYLKAQERALMA